MEKVLDFLKRNGYEVVDYDSNIDASIWWVAVRETSIDWSDAIKLNEINSIFSIDKDCMTENGLGMVIWFVTLQGE